MQLPGKPSEMFNRDDEWDDLARFAVDDAPGATLCVVSGRRRQGKTLLLYSLAQATDGLPTSPWQAVPCHRSSSRH